MMSGFIDISLPLRPGLVVWPGDPPFELRRTAELTRGDACNLSELHLGAHAGTHVDAPYHYIEAGARIDEAPIEALVGPARVLDFKVDRIGPAELEPHQIEAGERILLRTRNSMGALRAASFRPEFARLTAGGAEWLAGRGIAAVGIDYLSVGGEDAEGEAIHRSLLGAGIWLIEGLDLAAAAPGAYELICLPLRIEGAEAAPARALLRP